MKSLGAVVLACALLPRLASAEPSSTSWFTKGTIDGKAAAVVPDSFGGTSGIRSMHVYIVDHGVVDAGIVHDRDGDRLECFFHAGSLYFVNWLYLAYDDNHAWTSHEAVQRFHYRDRRFFSDDVVWVTRPGYAIASDDPAVLKRLAASEPPYEPSIWTQTDAVIAARKHHRRLFRARHAARI